MLRYNTSKPILLIYLVFILAHEEYYKKDIILMSLKENIKKKNQMGRPKNYGLHLMKSRHQNQRLRKFPHVYHDILHVFKRIISKNRNI